LMKDPGLVADCIKAMQDSTSIDVTIKHRIGIDDQDSYEEMRDFVGVVAETGCRTFIVHARKAILQGLSPKENREVPPLRYDDVYRLKREFPDLEIIVNGGIKTHAQIEDILPNVDGVMLGREAYQNPSILLDADQLYFDREANERSAKDAVRALYPYIDTLLAKGAPLHYVSRHILGLFNGKRGARLFRRFLSERAHLRESGTEVLEEALQLVD